MALDSQEVKNTSLWLLNGHSFLIKEEIVQLFIRSY